ncbi:DUF6415 family natural product biosynthesis protein [Streptomyces sp. NPDC088353]|uniref:DUF6415 family natural product biosynthesis protein n=1 Tax=Streptomyces sp. NPDC088353 TaxID=3365855 RepID=UPI0038232AD7
MSAAPTSPAGRLPHSTVTMRAAASWFLDQRTLPRHGTVTLFSRDFGRYLGELVEHVAQLAGQRSDDDVPARVALAGVGEARRRLDEPEAAGLSGEVARVKRLARSVVALCDHYEALTGVVMCLACDKPIRVGEESVPYEHVSPSGGSARAGRVHAWCVTAVRRR